MEQTRPTDIAARTKATIGLFRFQIRIHTIITIQIIMITGHSKAK